eukprot:snap_masked-scaffold_21-processed-gene-4.23-mRNA-1 protein AED:1.00 eAED:1.00 QI:0/0/0/0/1/1/2/0/218
MFESKSQVEKCLSFIEGIEGLTLGLRSCLLKDTKQTFVYTERINGQIFTFDQSLVLTQSLFGFLPRLTFVENTGSLKEKWTLGKTIPEENMFVGYYENAQKRCLSNLNAGEVNEDVQVMNCVDVTTRWFYDQLLELLRLESDFSKCAVFETPIITEANVTLEECELNEGKLWLRDGDLVRARESPSLVLSADLDGNVLVSPLSTPSTGVNSYLYYILY